MLEEAIPVILRWRMVPTFARAIWHAFLFWVSHKPVFAPKPIIAWRRQQCAKCPNNNRAPWPMCTACSCFLEPKTLLSSESCPIDRWKSLANQSKPQ